MKSGCNDDPELAAIAGLFPVTARFCLSRNPQAARPLMGEELVAARSMKARRLESFRHGRHCARLALEQLAVTPGPLPVGPGRAPAWPAGIAGSISHAGPVALAVVAARQDVVSLGVDVELPGPIEDGVIRLISLPDELEMLTRLAAAGVDARLLFSAKESIYKCLWPELERFIDFKEVQLQFMPQLASFSIVSAPTLPGRLVETLRGRYHVSPGLIVTSAYRLATPGC